MARNTRLTFKNNIAHDKVTGRYHVRVMVRGRVVQRAFPTRRAAVMFHEALVLDAAAQAYGLHTDVGPRTLEDAIEEYITDRRLYGLSEVTLSDYNNIAKRVYGHLGKSFPIHLRKRDINEYILLRQADGAGNRRILRELKMLRTMLKNTVGPEVVTWAIPALVLENIDHSIPTDEEIGTVYSSAREDVQTAILLALLTGMRAGDVFRASPRWRTDNLLAVEMSKRHGLVNVLPIIPTLKTRLDTLSSPLYVTSSKDAVKMALQRGEGTWSGVGHLRRVCATWASQAGFSEEDIGLVLGDAGATVARRHYIDDEGIKRKRRVLKAVEKRFLKAIEL